MNLNTQQNQNQNQSSIFGASTQQSSGAGLFGNFNANQNNQQNSQQPQAQNQNQNLQSQNNQPQQGSSIFSQNSLGLGQNAQNNPSQTGIFNQSQNNQQKQQQQNLGSGLFGQNQNQTQTQNQNQNSVAPSQNQPTSTQNTGLFGQNQNQAQKQTSNLGLFGNSQQNQTQPNQNQNQNSAQNTTQPQKLGIFNQNSQTQPNPSQQQSTLFGGNQSTQQPNQQPQNQQKDQQQQQSFLGNNANQQKQAEVKLNTDKQSTSSIIFGSQQGQQNQQSQQNQTNAKQSDQQNQMQSGLFQKSSQGTESTKNNTLNSQGTLFSKMDDKLKQAETKTDQQNSLKQESQTPGVASGLFGQKQQQNSTGSVAGLFNQQQQKQEDKKDEKKEEKLEDINLGGSALNMKKNISSISSTQTLFKQPQSGQNQPENKLNLQQSGQKQQSTSLFGQPGSKTESQKPQNQQQNQQLQKTQPTQENTSLLGKQSQPQSSQQQQLSKEQQAQKTNQSLQQQKQEQSQIGGSQTAQQQQQQQQHKKLNQEFLHPFCSQYYLPMGPDHYNLLIIKNINLFIKNDPDQAQQTKSQKSLFTKKIQSLENWRDLRDFTGNLQDKRNLELSIQNGFERLKEFVIQELHHLKIPDDLIHFYLENFLNEKKQKKLIQLSIQKFQIYVEYENCSNINSYNDRNFHLLIYQPALEYIIDQYLSHRNQALKPLINVVEFLYTQSKEDLEKPLNFHNLELIQYLSQYLKDIYGYLSKAETKIISIQKLPKHLPQPIKEEIMLQNLTDLIDILQISNALHIIYHKPSEHRLNLHYFEKYLSTTASQYIKPEQSRIIYQKYANIYQCNQIIQNENMYRLIKQQENIPNKIFFPLFNELTIHTEKQQQQTVKNLEIYLECVQKGQQIQLTQENKMQTQQIMVNLLSLLYQLVYKAYNNQHNLDIKYLNFVPKQILKIVFNFALQYQNFLLKLIQNKKSDSNTENLLNECELILLFAFKHEPLLTLHLKPIHMSDKNGHELNIYKFQQHGLKNYLNQHFKNDTAKTKFLKYLIKNSKNSKNYQIHLIENIKKDYHEYIVNTLQELQQIIEISSQEPQISQNTLFQIENVQQFLKFIAEIIIYRPELVEYFNKIALQIVQNNQNELILVDNLIILSSILRNHLYAKNQHNFFRLIKKLFQVFDKLLNKSRYSEIISNKLQIQQENYQWYFSIVQVQDAFINDSICQFQAEKIINSGLKIFKNYLRLFGKPILDTNKDALIQNFCNIILPSCQQYVDRGMFRSIAKNKNKQILQMKTHLIQIYNYIFKIYKEKTVDILGRFDIQMQQKQLYDVSETIQNVFQIQTSKEINQFVSGKFSQSELNKHNPEEFYQNVWNLQIQLNNHTLFKYFNKLIFSTLELLESILEILQEAEFYLHGEILQDPQNLKKINYSIFKREFIKFFNLDCSSSELNSQILISNNVNSVDSLSDFSLTSCQFANTQDLDQPVKIRFLGILKTFLDYHQKSPRQNKTSKYIDQLSSLYLNNFQYKFINSRIDEIDWSVLDNQFLSQNSLNLQFVQKIQTKVMQIFSKLLILNQNKEEKIENHLSCIEFPQKNNLYIVNENFCEQIAEKVWSIFLLDFEDIQNRVVAGELIFLFLQQKGILKDYFLKGKQVKRFLKVFSFYFFSKDNNQQERNQELQKQIEKLNEDQKQKIQQIEKSLNETEAEKSQQENIHNKIFDQIDNSQTDMILTQQIYDQELSHKLIVILYQLIVELKDKLNINFMFNLLQQFFKMEKKHLWVEKMLADHYSELQIYQNDREQHNFIKVQKQVENLENLVESKLRQIVMVNQNTLVIIMNYLMQSSLQNNQQKQTYDCINFLAQEQIYMHNFFTNLLEEVREDHLLQGIKYQIKQIIEQQYNQNPDPLENQQQQLNLPNIFDLYENSLERFLIQNEIFQQGKNAFISQNPLSGKNSIFNSQINNHCNILALFNNNNESLRYGGAFNLNYQIIAENFDEIEQFYPQNFQFTQFIQRCIKNNWERSIRKSGILLFKQWKELYVFQISKGVQDIPYGTCLQQSSNLGALMQLSYNQQNNQQSQNHILLQQNPVKIQDQQYGILNLIHQKSNNEYQSQNFQSQINNVIYDLNQKRKIGNIQIMKLEIINSSLQALRYLLSLDPNQVQFLAFKKDSENEIKQQNKIKIKINFQWCTDPIQKDFIFNIQTYMYNFSEQIVSLIEQQDQKASNLIQNIIPVFFNYYGLVNQIQSVLNIQLKQLNAEISLKIIKNLIKFANYQIFNEQFVKEQQGQTGINLQQCSVDQQQCLIQVINTISSIVDYDNNTLNDIITDFHQNNEILKWILNIFIDFSVNLRVFTSFANFIYKITSPSQYLADNKFDFSQKISHILIYKFDFLRQLIFCQGLDYIVKEDNFLWNRANYVFEEDFISEQNQTNNQKTNFKTQQQLQFEKDLQEVYKLRPASSIYFSWILQIGENIAYNLPENTDILESYEEKINQLTQNINKFAFYHLWDLNNILTIVIQIYEHYAQFSKQVVILNKFKKQDPAEKEKIQILNNISQFITILINNIYPLFEQYNDQDKQQIVETILNNSRLGDEFTEHEKILLIQTQIQKLQLLHHNLVNIYLLQIQSQNLDFSKIQDNDQFEFSDNEEQEEKKLAQRNFIYSNCLKIAELNCKQLQEFYEFKKNDLLYNENLNQNNINQKNKQNKGQLIFENILRKLNTDSFTLQSGLLNTFYQDYYQDLYIQRHHINCLYILKIMHQITDIEVNNFSVQIDLRKFLNDYQQQTEKIIDELNTSQTQNNKELLGDNLDQYILSNLIEFIKNNNDDDQIESRVQYKYGFQDLKQTIQDYCQQI